jgi:ClpP class serine protease
MDWFALIFFLMVVLPSISQGLLQAKRRGLIMAVEKKRGSRVIMLIHRQEVVNFLGFPIARYISIEDSEQVLRAIHLTPDDMPIDIILHTPGGLVLASHQIARALTRHKAKVSVLVPHYAMSGGTLIALAADEIVMDENAVLGPVDPQIGQYPAASLLRIVQSKPLERIADETLILADIAEKAVQQVAALVKVILTDRVPEQKVAPEAVDNIAHQLVSGIWTHDHPITVEAATEMGLPVKTGLPTEIYELMDLYPQSTNQKSPVQYIPIPYKRDPAHAVHAPPAGSK